MFRNPGDYQKICDFLGYSFKNQELLQCAITRKSGLREHKQPDHVGHNETLATYGDGILRTAIDNILLELNTQLTKGKLSQNRDSCVNNNTLAEIAIKNNLNDFIIMGNHESNKNSKKYRKMLADSLEAIIAAIFKDSNDNLLPVKRFIIKTWGFIDYYTDLFIGAVLQENLKNVHDCITYGVDPNLLIYIGCTSAAQKYINPSLVWWDAPAELKLPRTFPKVPTFPLLMAANINSIELAELLLNHGARVNQADILDLTPLYDAATRGHIRMAELLIRYGAIHSQELGTGYTPLHTAAYHGNTGMVKFLLQNGAEINKKDRYGTTPLHTAAWQGHTETVRSLLAQNAIVDIESRNDKNNLVETPLHRAVNEGHIEVIKLLILYGADINKQDHDGQTSLHRAVIKSNLSVIKELLKNNPILDKVDRTGKQALDLTSDDDIIKVFSEMNLSNSHVFNMHSFFSNQNSEEDDEISYPSCCLL